MIRSLTLISGAFIVNFEHVFAGLVMRGQICQNCVIDLLQVAVLRTFFRNA